MNKHPDKQTSSERERSRFANSKAKYQQSKFQKKGDDRICIAGWRFQKEDTVAGVNPVIVAFQRALVKKLVISKDEGRIELLEIASQLSEGSVRRVSRFEFDDANICDRHQDVVCEITPLPNPDISEVVSCERCSLVVLLDGVTDPHNAGAIVRTATAVGASSVVLPKRSTAGLSPTFYKASAGTGLILPICRDVNLSQTLDKLSREGFWSIAATSQPKSSDKKRIDNVVDAINFKFPEKCVLILGGEGEGIKEKLEDKSDYRVYLPISESVESLNVSVAAGILMYMWKVSIGYCF